MKIIKSQKYYFCGNHQKVEQYRKEEAIFNTYKNRPDLLKKAIDKKIVSNQEVDGILKERKVKE